MYLCMHTMPPRVHTVSYCIYGLSCLKISSIHLGISLKLRHIRNGKELPPIDANLHYNFDFQPNSVIPLVKILPVSVQPHIHIYTDSIM